MIAFIFNRRVSTCSKNFDNQYKYPEDVDMDKVSRVNAGTYVACIFEYCSCAARLNINIIIYSIYVCICMMNDIVLHIPQIIAAKNIQRKSS
jgi:hypothetical protein